MTGDKYDVIFAGKILPDQDPAAVRERIGTLFRAGAQQLDRLFSGTPVSIKKGIYLTTAVRYRDAIKEAGALVELRKSVAGGTEAPPAPRPEPSAPEPAPAVVATAASPPPAVPEAPDSMTLAPANTGSLEDCAPAVSPAPVPDISHLNLAPAGENFPATPPPPPLRVDTDELSLLPPKTGSLEDCQDEPYPIPVPDISHLEMVLPEGARGSSDRKEST